MKQVLTFILMLSLTTMLANAQSGEKDSTRSYSSSELLSSYYDSPDFQPFAKGKWYTKLSFSLSDKDLQNSARLFDRVEAGNDLSYGISISAGHFLKDYFAVGAGVDYNESSFEGAIINMDSDTIQTNTISRDISIAPNIRLVMPLSKNERLSLYNDIGVSFGYGRSLKRETQEMDEIYSQFSDRMTFGIGFSPGITYFAFENFAFEAGLNLMGYRMNIEKSTDGDGIKSKKVEHDVNLRLNLLSLKMGVSYFF